MKHMQVLNEFKNNSVFTEQVINSLVQTWWDGPFNFNQVCWSREHLKHAGQRNPRSPAGKHWSNWYLSISCSSFCSHEMDCQGPQIRPLPHDNRPLRCLQAHRSCLFDRSLFRMYPALTKSQQTSIMSLSPRWLQGKSPASLNWVTSWTYQEYFWIWAWEIRHGLNCHWHYSNWNHALTYWYSVTFM